MLYLLQNCIRFFKTVKPGRHPPCWAKYFLSCPPIRKKITFTCWICFLHAGRSWSYATKYAGRQTGIFLLTLRIAADAGRAEKLIIPGSGPFPDAVAWTGIHEERASRISHAMEKGVHKDTLITHSFYKHLPEKAKREIRLPLLSPPYLLLCRIIKKVKCLFQNTLYFFLLSAEKA